MSYSPAPFFRLLTLFLAVGLFCTSPVSGQVASQQKVTEGTGGFSEPLDGGDAFGRSVAYLGDVLGDNRPELAVGAYTTDANGTSNAGAVWIVSLNDDGTIESHAKITEGSGGFTGTLDANDQFGTSVTSLGSMDGHPTLAVGARYDDDGGTRRGAVWILFLASDGTVARHQKISSSAGNGPGMLADGDQFGQEVANVGDLNDDDRNELAVGATGTNNKEGRVWTLFLNSDGTVNSTGRIDGSSPGPTLDEDDDFGFSISRLGNLSGNGNRNIAVGAFRDDDGAENAGAVWIVSLADDGTAAGAQKISATSGGFPGTLLNEGDRFGSSTAAFGDLNEDGVPDLAVGAYLDDDGGTDRGAVYILYLASDGTVADYRKISDTDGGFGGSLADEDQFGISMTGVGTLNDDAHQDLVVGAFGDDEADSNAGAFWVLFGEKGLLPVELASFEATQAERDAVELRWTTASEQNNAGFRVQHRGPGTTEWQDRSFVTSIPPGGTSSDAHRYRHRIEKLGNGTHHFRLKQVDLDGTPHLHDPSTVHLQMEDPLTLEGPVPNPVQNHATLSFGVQEANETTIALYNLLGQKVSTLYRGLPSPGQTETVELDASSLSSGTYLIRIRAGGHEKTHSVTIVR